MAVEDCEGIARVVRIRQTDGGVRVSFPDSVDRTNLKKTVSHCLRMDEDYSGFYRLCDGNSVLAGAARNGAGRILRSPCVFEDLVKSICGTNIAWRQAVKMIHAISELADGNAGNGPKLFPYPEAILEAGEGWLRKRARAGYRAAYIIDLCEKVVAGELDLSPVDRGELKGDDLKKFFMSIKGIGKSTAHYLLTLHGEYSCLYIDSSIHALMRKMTGKEMGDDQIERRYRGFGEWKALAMWYEWFTHSGWLESFEG